MNVPRVSIIMNCLNGENDLPESLASVKEQTFQDYEIIFWDNGSTDNSASIAQGFGQKLLYFRSKETVPLGAARNLAIAKAHGDLIAFLDCDDLWRPSKLEKQVALFDANPAVGLVCTDTEIFDSRGVLYKLFEQAPPERGNVFSALMKKQWISMSSAMIRRAALDDLLHGKFAANLPGTENAWFDESLNVCEEADVFYRIAHDWELDYIDEPLTCWRVHGKNTTFKKFGQFANETLQILEKHRTLYPDYDLVHGDLVTLLTNRANFQKAVDLWRRGRGAEARKLLGKQKSNSAKYRLFWIASFLPGAMFDLLGRLYFALPASFRR